MILDNVLKFFGLSTPSPAEQFFYSDSGRQTLAGVDISESVALTYSMCWACTRFISSTVAGLPFKLMRKTPEGNSVEASELPLFDLLKYGPNYEITSFGWRTAAIAQQVNWGNCYAEIERNGYGDVVALWPLHPSRVTPKRDENDYLYYEVANQHRGPTYLSPDQMFHVPSQMTENGIVGKGVIRHARETIGRALATERYGAAHFGNGARPSAILKSKNKVDQQARTNLRSEWNQLHQGPANAGNVAVLWDDMEYESIATTPEDSQYLGSMQWNASDVARWYSVPPHLAGLLDRATNNNIEVQGLEAIKFCLLPYILGWEQEAHRKLLTPQQQADGYHAELIVDGLERADSTTRTAVSKEQFFNGVLTPNEWRKRENLPPMGPEGDLHYVQSAMVTIEAAAQAKPPYATFPQPQLPAPPPPPPVQISEAPKQLAYRAASLDVVGEIVGVMLSHEANAAARAAKKPGFSEWLDSYYAEHTDKMRKALANSVRACVLTSDQVSDADDVLERALELHVAASKEQLLAAGNVEPAERAVARVQKCAAEWQRTEIVDYLKGRIQ